MQQQLLPVMSIQAFKQRHVAADWVIEDISLMAYSKLLKEADVFYIITELPSHWRMHHITSVCLLWLSVTMSSETHWTAYTCIIQPYKLLNNRTIINILPLFFYTISQGLTTFRGPLVALMGCRILLFYHLAYTTWRWYQHPKYYHKKCVMLIEECCCSYK